MSKQTLLTLICDLTAVLLIAGLFLINRRYRKQRGLAGKLSAALLADVAGVAVFGAADTFLLLVLESENFYWITVSHTLSSLLIESFFPLLLFRFLCDCGREEQLRKKWRLFAIPALLSFLLLILNLPLGFLFHVDYSSMRFVREPLYFLLYLPMAWYFLHIAFLLWKMNKIALVILCSLLLLWLYFDTMLPSISLLPFTLALGLFIIEILLTRHGLLYEIGSVLLLLFLSMTLVSGNLVTTSAFSSFLANKYEIDHRALQEIETSMNSYQCLPWLLSYIKDHIYELNSIDNIGEWLRDQEETFLKLEEAIGDRTGSDLTPEDVAAFSPELQEYWAVMCYSDLDYTFTSVRRDYDLNDLVLVYMEENTDGFVLFEAASEYNFDLSLGRSVRRRNLEKAWKNFEEASGPPSLMNWTWLRYSDSEPFGLYLDILTESDGPIYRLYTNIYPSEIDAELSFASRFRRQSIYLSLLISAVILFLLYMLVLRPLSRVEKSVKEYQQEKDAGKVRLRLSGIHSHNEIGAFAHQFADLTEDMEDYTKQLVEMAETQERISGEMRLAADIQRGALSVDFPDCPEFSLWASMTPAWTIGGDFYDFFRIGEDRLAVVIADVSGKGIPAALYMMSAKIMIRNRARMGGTPAEILNDVNIQLLETHRKIKAFVTVWLGILDLRSGEMICTNAGHEYPFHREPDGVFRKIKDPHGLVLGGMKASRYKDYRITLAPGDAIFVYTDGVPEAAAASGEFFTMARLEATLNEIPRDSIPEDILKAVQEKVNAFTVGAEQFDDLTMLCLIYHGNSD